MTPEIVLEAEPVTTRKTAVAEAAVELALARSFEGEVAALMIHTDGDYESAAAVLLDAKERNAALEVKRKRIVDPINAALKEINDLFRAPREALENIVGIINDKLTGYRQDQERKRLALEVELRRQQAEEQERIRKEAAEQAKVLEAAGNAEAAAVILDAAEATVAMVPTPVVTREIPKVKGTATRTTWRWRCKVPGCSRLDCGHLIEALPKQYLMVNEQAVSAQVRALKDRSNLPGIEVYSEEAIGRTGR